MTERPVAALPDAEHPVENYPAEDYPVAGRDADDPRDAAAADPQVANPTDGAVRYGAEHHEPAALASEQQVSEQWAAERYGAEQYEAEQAYPVPLE